MEKVKVNKRLFKCLNYWLNEYGENLLLKSLYIKEYKNEKWVSSMGEEFNLYETDFLYKCIKNGFEVEETKEEILLRIYNMSNNSEASSYNRGFSDGVKYALETLNIEIDGITK